MPGGASFNRGNSAQNFATPRIFGAAVLEKLGIEDFMFDFAANSENAVSLCYWDKQTDALKQTDEDWLFAVQQPYRSGWGWLNPPFDDIEPWAEKMTVLRDKSGSCAFLVPAAVGSNWWRDYTHGVAYVLLINGRIPFDPLKPHWGYPKDCALCLYSPEREPGYEVWSWLQDVPEDLLAAHKAACTEARAREKAEKAATLESTQ